MMKLYAGLGRLLGQVLPGIIMLTIFIPIVSYAQTQQVSEIVIMGNEHISREAIQAVLPLKVGTPYSEEVIRAAKQALEKMGYFSSVTVGIENLESGVRVLFNVVENPVVTQINITGNTVIPTDKLRSVMRTTVGGVFNSSTFNQDLISIENTYSDQGYIALIQDNTGLDPNKSGVVNIYILEVRIEDVRVTGNKKTKTIVVLREMQSKPGDVYNKRTLFADIQRIYDLGIFDRETAEPFLVQDGSAIGKVVIVIPVKEKKTGEVTVGFGYSSRQRLVGQAKISETNFRGMGQTINGMWEQGGTNGASFEFGFFEPWLDKRHSSLGVNLYDKLIYRFSSDLFAGQGSGPTNYNERRIGGSGTWSRPLNARSRGFFTVRDEFINTENFSSFISQKGTVASGTFRVTTSTRDSEIDPFTGAYSVLSAEVGNARTEVSPGSFTDTLFTKYSVDLRTYLSKGGRRKDLNERRRRIGVRVMAGTLTGNVPFFEQFFVGGAETLRGYREDRFWGKSMFIASIEPRFPIAPNLDGVLFVDIGDAWGASNIFVNPNNPALDNDPTLKSLLQTLPQSSGFHPQIGYGPGIRVMTPLGQLRLDYGFGSEGSRAHFSFGQVF